MTHSDQRLPQYLGVRPFLPCDLTFWHDVPSGGAPRNSPSAPRRALDVERSFYRARRT